MSNFPVGSKIIITNADRGEVYENGDILTIANTDDNSGCGVHATFNGATRYISNREFEAYTEPFKVGDEVITTAADAVWEYKAGVEGTVTCIDTDEPKICVSGLGYAYTWDLKLAPAKAEPTPTSHIKVLATGHPREYEVGDILEVHAEQWNIPEAGEIRVVNKHGGNSIVFKGQWEYVAAPVKVEPEPLAEWEKELLNVTPRTIAFEDILKGDTIRAEYTQDDVKYIQEGVADREKYEGWVSKTGIWIAAPHYENATYTLLERPEPPKPNPFAEAKVGSIATSNEGERYYIWIKESEQGWRAYSVGGDYRSSHPTSDEALRADSTLKITYSAS